MKKLNIVITALAFGLLAVGGTKAVEAVQHSIELDVAEGKCISELIALQYERSELDKGNGTCWVK